MELQPLIRGDITPVIRPFIGVITLLITSRDPPCRERTLFADPELRYFFFAARGFETMKHLAMEKEISLWFTWNAGSELLSLGYV